MRIRDNTQFRPNYQCDAIVTSSDTHNKTELSLTNLMLSTNFICYFISDIVSGTCVVCDQTEKMHLQIIIMIIIIIIIIIQKMIQTYFYNFFWADTVL